MAVFDCEEELKEVRFMLRTLGSWPLDHSPWKQRSLRVIWMSLVTMLGTGAFLQGLRDERFENKSFGFCTTMITVIGIAKYVIFYLKEPQFVIMWNFLKNPLIATHEDELDKHLQTRLRIVQRFRYVYLWTIGIAVVTIGLSPIVYLRTNRITPAPFPVDLNQSTAIFLSVWGFQAVAAGTVAWSEATFEITVISFMQMAIGQLEMLRERVSTVVNASLAASYQNQKEPDTNFVDNKETSAILRKCVRQHVVIQDYINSVQEAFGLTYLAQLIGSLFLICLVGINFVLVPIVSMLFARAFFLFGCSTLQLAVYCLTGNEVIYQSSRVGDSCYLCDWKQCGPSARKSLLLIMERSKRPFALTASKFLTLSHETFLSVLNSSFSYFTVIWQLYKDAGDAR